MYQTVIALEFHQHRFHTLRNRVLAFTHHFRHGLIHLHHLRLPTGQNRLDLFVVSLIRGKLRTNSPRPDHHTCHIQIDQHVFHGGQPMRKHFRLVTERFAEAALVVSSSHRILKHLT